MNSHRQPDTDNLNASKRGGETALASFSFAFFFTAFYVGMRSAAGYAEILPPLKALGYSGFLLFLPVFLRMRFPAIKNGSTIFLALLCPPLLFVLIGPIGAWSWVCVVLSWLVTLAGLTHFGRNALNRFSAKKIALWLLMSLLLALAVAGISGWSSGATSPLYLEKIMLGPLNHEVRYAHPDELFHTAVAQMIRTYGVPSTGLDGLPAIHYHVGSHYFLAGLATILGIDLITIYQLAMMILVFPLFFNTLILATEETCNDRQRWPALLAAFSIPLFLFNNNLLQRISSFTFNLTSESFFLACTLAFTLFLYLLERRQQLTSPASLKAMSALERLTTGMFCVIAIAAISLSKISVGYAAMGAIGYLALRTGLFKRLEVVMTLGLAALAFLAAFRFFTNKESNTGFLPFALHHDGRPTSLAGFYLLHFSLVTAYAAFRLWPTGKAWSKRGLLDVELLIVVMLGCLLPCLLFTLNGDWFYFTAIPNWVALPLLIGILANRFALEAHKSRLRAGLIALAAVLAASHSAKVFVKATREDLANFRAADGIPLPNGGIVESLQAIGRDIPDSQKKMSALFVPKSNRAFWDVVPLCKGNWWPPTPQFIGPALTGMAMISGLPERNCAPFAYNMVAYKFPNSEPRDLDNAEVCRRARQHGFNRVVKISQRPNKSLERTDFPCP